MKLPSPLLRGCLIERYKRFFADVELEDGTKVTAHCPNPGSMMGLKEPGTEVYLSESDNPKRKLKYTWELLVQEGAFVGINTNLPNKIALEAISEDLIGELQGYTQRRTEVRYGKNSRIDILLENEGAPPCYVEIKNVHLSRTPQLAEFPDSVTARGAKHLEELGDMAQNGARSVMLFLVQRTDCKSFGLAGDIDRTYEEAMKRALDRGVEVLCYDCSIDLAEIRVRKALPVEFQAEVTK